MNGNRRRRLCPSSRVGDTGLGASQGRRPSGVSSPSPRRQLQRAAPHPQRCRAGKDDPAACTHEAASGLLRAYKSRRGFEPATTAMSWSFPLARRGDGISAVAFLVVWCRDPDLNWGHLDFQSSALPTELSRQRRRQSKCDGRTGGPDSPVRLPGLPSPSALPTPPVSASGAARPVLAVL